ncbi:transposase [Glutamicibacter sp. Je.9.36]|uniref:transposase n=1 Tax=Glutamicibacter sp. Je.9.36 TaxID=3142837 RepID=UPI003DA86668
MRFRVHDDARLHTFCQDHWYPQALFGTKQVDTLDEQLKNIQSQLDELVLPAEASKLLNENDCKVITAAKCVVAWSHARRVRSEAAFATLTGTSPIPASTGNTNRHQLNRGDNRTLHSAMHMVAVTCMIHGPESESMLRNAVPSRKPAS